MQKMRLRFFKNLLFKYFLFGYLCLLGIIILLSAAFFIYKTFLFPKNLISLIFVFCSFPVIGQFLRILFSTHYKYRYYKISLYRLKTRGYKDEYFECEMHEPCFRLIIRDLLISNGLSKEYFELCKKCHGKNLRVEKAKEKLLAKVMKEHAEKAI